MRAYLPSYELVVPRTLGEALALLRDEPGVWRPFAGGTDLMVLLEAGKLEHRKFFSIRHLPELRGVAESDGHVRVGALTSYTDVRRSDVLELSPDHATVIEKREIGRTFIDETGFEEIDGEVVKERRQLAYDGVVTPVVTIDEESGELEGEPEVVARGVLGLDGNGDSAALLRDMRRVVTAAVEAASRDERRDSSILKERVRLELKRYIQKQTGARPVILPVVVQI